MYLHTKRGKPILLDLRSNKFIYSNSESDLPIATKFDPDDVDMIIKDKRIIGHLIGGMIPKHISVHHHYNKAKDRLEKLSQSKIQKEEGELIPALGMSMWDPPIYITGATGSGKSTIASKIIKNDMRERPVFLFTNHEQADPSLRSIWGRSKRVVMRHPVDNLDGKYPDIPEIAWNQANLEGAICLFDDIGQNTDFRELRDQLLEEGRHMDIVVIVLDHGIKPNVKNKKCFEECRTVVLFPHSNQPSINKLLERYYDLPARVRKKIIELSNRDGRYLIYHQADPMFVSTAKTCLLLHPLLNT